MRNQIVFISVRNFDNIACNAMTIIHIRSINKLFFFSFNNCSYNTSNTFFQNCIVKLYFHFFFRIYRTNDEVAKCKKYINFRVKSKRNHNKNKFLFINETIKQNIQQFLKFSQITKRKKRNIEFIKITTTIFSFLQID